MKKIFVLSMLILLAMICSCQKQESAAEQQLAQRKAELDAREKALAEREKAVAGLRRIPPDLQSRGQVRDPAQLKAERDRRLQQLPRDVQALIPDRSRIQAEKDEKDRMIQEQLAQRQRRMEELQRLRMSPAVKPGAAASPEAEATSPTPSPTPQ
jgi:chromosome segregation ATPase